MCHIHGDLYIQVTEIPPAVFTCLTETATTGSTPDTQTYLNNFFFILGLISKQNCSDLPISSHRRATFPSFAIASRFLARTQTRLYESSSNCRLVNERFREHFFVHLTHERSFHRKLHRWTRVCCAFLSRSRGLNRFFSKFRFHSICHEQCSAVYGCATLAFCMRICAI